LTVADRAAEAGRTLSQNQQLSKHWSPIVAGVQVMAGIGWIWVQWMGLQLPAPGDNGLPSAVFGSLFGLVALACGLWLWQRGHRVPLLVLDGIVLVFVGYWCMLLNAFSTHFL
jgi:hypothetical protein